MAANNKVIMIARMSVAMTSQGFSLCFISYLLCHIIFFAMDMLMGNVEFRQILLHRI